MMAPSSFVAVLFGIFLYVNVSSGLGINCRGSSNCSGLYSLNRLTGRVCNDVPGNNVYNPGVRIATDCKGASGIAAFVQSTSQSITGADACRFLRELQNHGCAVCGSIPLYPGNDVSQGQLTVNFVGACG